MQIVFGRQLMDDPVAMQPAQVTTYRFANAGMIPNHPCLPLLVYLGGLPLTGDEPAALAEQVFARHGWGHCWRNGIYAFPHYHSSAHEVLAICRGQAQVRFGGNQGVELTVQAGDVVVIPAGVGHERLSASADLLVVGAYPPGQVADLCDGRQHAPPYIVAQIAQTALPVTDPVYGARGPLLDLWRACA